MKPLIVVSACFALWMAPSVGRADQAGTDPLAKAKEMMGAPKKKPGPKKPAVTTYPFAGEISTYSEKSLVIKGEGDLSDHKYIITPQTQYVGKGPKPASYTDLRMHRWVGLTLKHTPSGIDEVVKIDLTAKKPFGPKKK